MTLSMCRLSACPLLKLQLLVSPEPCTEGRDSHSLSAASWRWGLLWLIVIAIEIGLHGVRSTLSPTVSAKVLIPTRAYLQARQHMSRHQVVLMTE